MHAKQLFLRITVVVFTDFKRFDAHIRLRLIGHLLNGVTSLCAALSLKGS